MSDKRDQTTSDNPPVHLLGVMAAAMVGASLLMVFDLPVAYLGGCLTGGGVATLVWVKWDLYCGRKP